MVHGRTSEAEKEFHNVLRDVRDETLARMAAQGFYSEAKGPRYDPIPWDINCGGCEDFAMAVLDKLAGQAGITTLALEVAGALPDGTEVAMLWLDEMPEFDETDPPSHCVLRFKGRYFDSECLEGRDQVTDLPIFTGRTRDSALVEWEKTFKGKEGHASGLSI